MVDVTLVSAGPNSMAGAAPLQRSGGRLMARRDLAAVPANERAAPGSSSSSTSPICSGRCSAITTAT